MTWTVQVPVSAAPPESVISEGSSTPVPTSGNNGQPQPTSVATLPTNAATNNNSNNTISHSTMPSILQPQQLLAFEERLQLKPYAYESMEIKQAIPSEVVQLWIEVGNGIVKNETGKVLLYHFFFLRGLIVFEMNSIARTLFAIAEQLMCPALPLIGKEKEGALRDFHAVSAKKFVGAMDGVL